MTIVTLCIYFKSYTLHFTNFTLRYGLTNPGALTIATIHLFKGYVGHYSAYAIFGNNYFRL